MDLHNLELAPVRLPDVTNHPDKVQLSRISHVYFEHPDLDKFSQFAYDFGFEETARQTNPANGKPTRIYYRGYGKDPYVYVAATPGRSGIASSYGSHAAGEPQFKGAAFVAKTADDFEKAKKVPGANLTVADLSGEGAPGGGHRITFARPNGTFLHIVYGQQERVIEVNPTALSGGPSVPTETHVHHSAPNLPFEKVRFGHFQRYKEGRALVHKLGHYGYVCHQDDKQAGIEGGDFLGEYRFYTGYFNFKPSDVLHQPGKPDVDLMTFYTWISRAIPDDEMKSDGEKRVQRTFVHHTSYEVFDLDTQMLGHEHLARKGWQSVWGVGRHIQGSQIFDYWKDPTGFRIEHYIDGDLVNEDSPIRREPAGALSIWGPELPADFHEDLTIVKVKNAIE